MLDRALAVLAQNGGPSAGDSLGAQLYLNKANALGRRGQHPEALGAARRACKASRRLLLAYAAGGGAGEDSVDSLRMQWAGLAEMFAVRLLSPIPSSSLS